MNEENVGFSGPWTQQALGVDQSSVVAYYLFPWCLQGSALNSKELHVGKASNKMSQALRHCSYVHTFPWFILTLRLTPPHLPALSDSQDLAYLILGFGSCSPLTFATLPPQLQSLHPISCHLGTSSNRCSQMP